MNKPNIHDLTRWAPAVISALLVTLVLGGLTWYAGQTRAIVQATRQTQINNTKLNEQTHANTTQLKAIARAVVAGNNRIKDCIEPTGECAKRNAAGTAAAIGSINENTLFTAACSATIPSNLTTADGVLTYLRTCVAALNENGAPTQPRRTP